jgi:hypothetical protein
MKTFPISLTKRFAAVLPMLALSGCLVTPTVQFEKVYLCKAEPGSVWKGEGTNVVLDRDGVRYRFQVVEGQQPDENFYWVQLNVDSEYGTKVDGKYVPSKNRLPMIYDPTDAWIEVNGKRTAAVPKLWAGSGGPSASRRGLELPVPANVNPPSDKVYNDVFIGFPIRAPWSREKYRFNPGSIMIDGVKTPLPVFESCFSPIRTGWDYVRC